MNRRRIFTIAVFCLSLLSATVMAQIPGLPVTTVAATSVVADSGTVVLSPGLLHVYEQSAVTPITAIVYVGDFIGGHTADQVDPASVRVDGDIVPTSVDVLDSYGDFTGAVLQISYSVRDYLLKQGSPYDTVVVALGVTGDFDDATSFVVGGDMTLVGLLSGDVNLDGKVNVSDVMALVADIFQGQPAPRLEAGDVDGRCGVDVADVTCLVRNVLSGSPALQTPCTSQ